jgi:hypothetical protein
MSDTINPLTGLAPEPKGKETADIPVNPLTQQKVDITRSPVAPIAPIDLSHYSKSFKEYNREGWWSGTGRTGISTLPQAPNWDEQLARSQNLISKWGNGTSKMLFGTIPTAITENLIGPLYGLALSPFKGTDYIWDNPIGQYSDKWNEYLKEKLPNYYTEAEMDPNRGLFSMDSLGSANFWADKALNGAGYMFASMATIGLTGGTGLGARALAQSAKALSKSAQLAKAGKVMVEVGKTGGASGRLLSGAYKGLRPSTARGLDVFRQVEMGLMMSGAEASIEAREIQKRIYAAQVEEYLNTYTGISEEDIPESVKDEFRKNATAAGNSGYAANMAVLVPTNMASFTRMLGPGFRSSLGIKGSAHMDLSKRMGTLPDGTFGVLPRSRAATFATRAQPYARQALSEGFQEGSQYGIGEYQMARRVRGMGAIQALNESLSETLGSTDGLESVFLGALIGTGGQFSQRLMYGSQTRRRKEVMDKAIKDMEVFQNVMQNIEVTEANAALIEMMESAKEEGNMELYKDLQYTLIANNAARLQDVGLLDTALGMLDNMKNMSDEDFKKSMGYDLEKDLPQSKSQIIDELKERLEKHAKRREFVQEHMLNMPEMGLLDELYYKATGQLEAEQKRRLTAKEAQRFYGNVLYNRLARLDGHNERLQNIKEELAEKFPELNVDSLVFEFDSLGEVTFDEETGEPILNDRPITIEELSKALGENEQLKQLGQKLRSEGKLEELQELYSLMLGLVHNSLSIGKTSEAVDQLQNLPDDSVGFYKMMNAMKERQERLHAKEQEEAANRETEDAIANAETPADLEAGVSPNASLDQKNRALEKRDRMEREIEAMKKKFLQLPDELLFRATPSSKLEKLALDRAQAERIGRVEQPAAETAEQRAINRATGVTGRDSTPREERQQQLEEAFAPENLGGVQIADASGSVFIIEGKTYYNHFSKPEEALERSEDGQITSVTLHDESGNRRVFRNEQRVDALAFAILLAINNTTTSSTAETRELDIAAVKERAEETDTPSMDQNAESRSDDQLQAELLELNADLKEVSDVLDELVRYYKSLGFTAKEINEDQEVKELRSIKKKIAGRIQYRAKKMRQRMGKDNDTSKVKQGDPYIGEVQRKIDGIQDQIDALDNEIAALVDFRDNGQYNPEDREYIQKEIKKLRDKKYRLGRKLKKEQEKLVNYEEQAAEKSARPAEQPSDGVEDTIGGQESQGEESDTSGKRDTEEVDLSQEAQEQRISDQEAQAAGESPQSDVTGDVSTKEEQPTGENPVAEMKPLSSNLKNQKGELETGDGYKPIGELDADGNVVLKERSARAGQQRQLLNDPNIGPGTEVEFVLLEEFDEETVGIQLAGTNTIIGNLSKNDSAEYAAIVSALRAGQPATAKITNKVFNNSNITTVVDEDGNALFMPVDLESFEGAKLGVLMGEQRTGFYYYFREEMTEEEQEEVNAHIFRHKDTVEPGTVVMVVKNPNGKPQVLYLSTRQLTAEAISAVIEHIDNGNAAEIQEIVGFNKIPMDKSLELHFDEQAGLFNMPVGGGLYVTINMQELSKLLKGEKAQYSFSKIEYGEQGFGDLRSIPSDQKNYEQHTPEAIKAQFLDTLKQKRFNVNPALMTAEGEYTDKFTGQTHPSYYHYLTQPIGLAEREEGKGHNAILTRRFAKRGAGVHFDITLEFGDITTPEGVKPADESPVADRRRSGCRA